MSATISLGRAYPARSCLLCLAAALVGLSVLLALSSLKTALAPLGFCTALGVLVLLFLLQPSALEMLFFLLPPILVLIPALTGLKEIYVTIIWLIGLSVIWYVKGLAGQWQERSVRTPYAFLLSAYCAIFIVSDLINPKTSASYSSMTQAISMIFVYWMLAQTLSGENLKRILIAILWGTLAGSLAFLIAFSRGSPQAALAGFALGIMRPIVLDYNANSWALYPMIGLPLLTSLALFGFASRLHQAWLIPSGLFLLFVALINMSRSALLGIVISLIFVVATHRRARRLMWTSAIAGIAILLMLKPELLEVVKSVLRVQRGLSGRENIWPVALDFISKNPFLGIGPGQFTERFFFNMPFMNNGLRYSISQSSTHSAFLAIGTDLGIFAIILALGVFAMFAYRSRASWRFLRGKPDFAILLAISALMLAGFMRALFETDFIEPHGYITANMVLITLLALQDQLCSREFPPP